MPQNSKSVSKQPPQEASVMSFPNQTHSPGKNTFTGAEQPYQISGSPNPLMLMMLAVLGTNALTLAAPVRKRLLGLRPRRLRTDKSWVWFRSKGVGRA